MVSPCDDIPDFELLRRMAEKQANFAEARIAWGYFYVRHHRFLMRVCMADHRYVLGMEGVKDIVQQSFLKAFDGAETFDYAEVCEVSVQSRRSRGWLVQIAENLVRDRFRNQPDVCLVDDGEIEQLPATVVEEPDANPVPESKRLSLLKTGFTFLSEVEQAVLRATMFWWQPDQQHQRMPHTALVELSNQIGKSPENIRQIRNRAIRKLEKYVNRNLDDKKED
jgi:RNA polymerase sigma factor (sigma-70 family)